MSGPVERIVGGIPATNGARRAGGVRDTPGGAESALSAETPAWPLLDPAALYGLAGDVVRTIEPHSEADPAALLVSFLAGYGSAVNAGPHAVADGAHHPPRLHVVVVGDTAKARKGTSWRRVRRPLALADAGWADRIVGGLSSGEGLIQAVADPTEDKDGNPVGGVADKRLLVVEEEFSRVLTVARRESNILSAVLRQAWDDGRLCTMTRAPLVATGAHVSVLGHITVAELRSKLTEVDQANGFANRHLWVCARRSKLLPNGGGDRDEDYIPLAARISARLMEARKRGLLVRTPDADARWVELYEQMADDDPGGLLGAVTARAEAHVLRLSVVYATVDAAHRIELPHLEAAWALWRYCRDSAAYIFGDTIGDEVADRLLAAVRAAGPAGLDLTQQSDVFGRNVKAKRLTAARAELEALGLIETVPEETGGRPRMVSFATTKKTKDTKEGRRP